MQGQSLQQPRAFYIIFFIELWERFGYYGMQALLVTFFVLHKGLSDTDANFLFAGFTAYAYLLPTLGGYIGDRVLGTKRTILLGALTLAAGYSLFADQLFGIYTPLAIISVGNGLFKANPSSLLSKLYANNDIRLDGGFTLYYMAVNIGAFFSISLTPYIAHHIGWDKAFWVSCGGLIIASINFLLFWSRIADIGSTPDFQPLNPLKFLLVLLGMVVLTLFGSYLFTHHTIETFLLSCAAIIVLTLYIIFIVRAKSYERPPMILALILMIEAVFYFVLYQQSFTSVNLFALRNVQRSLFGIPMEAENYQALNPFWIFVMSPILASLYFKLGRLNKDFSIPTKFAIGMFFVSIGFLVLPLSEDFTDSNGMVSGVWLFVSYFFQSTGELLISALGLAMVARFIPQRLMGFTMGTWLLSTSVGFVIAGYVANIASIPQNITDPTTTLTIYTDLFFKLGLGSLLLSVTMSLLVPFLKRLIRDGQP